ncbi:MAG TPA: ATP-dependent DNA helicase RecG [Acidimicrobiales bacterium]|nr:ATP-dependent DNA helicase RecG [Acidimicrobiales bacterium]
MPTPKVSARYASKCPGCGNGIAVGDDVFKPPSAAGWICASCESAPALEAPAKAAAPDPSPALAPTVTRGRTSLAELGERAAATLSGVGPKTATALAAFEIESHLDLLTHYPRRYIDRTNEAAIKDLVVGEESMVLAKVVRTSTRRTRNAKTMVTADVTDGKGFLRCTFFNQPWRTKSLNDGTEAVFFGKVEVFQGRKQMTNPIVDVIGDKTGKIVAVYPQSEKVQLSSDDIGRLVRGLIDDIGPVADPLPERWRDELDLVDRTWAFRQIHEPESLKAKDAARQRLVLDELLRLQMTLVMRKRAVERESKGILHTVAGQLVERFHASLPFELTGAQRRAIDEIAADLAGPHPMHRLLQGDVGSGKTLVALTAMLVAVQGGHQGALMAPTEVLAEQHFLTMRDVLGGLEVPAAPETLFGDRPLRVEVLTGRTPAGERAKLLAALASGEVDLLVGTHALLTEGVEFHRLGVVVIDEQHRFGVEQRAALRGKGTDPDVLVMTATPIPRTAAMTVYGDLDTTNIDEMPPGRKPIRTVWARNEADESEAWALVRSEVEGGRQAYVVCPLIEESEKVQARSAEDEHARLATEELAGLRLGLMHGRMTSREKEAVMTAFRSRELDVLVSTTVIEVGVDVPNASVMVIEDADRFGIAQLHQLRGRVGRGADKSWCYLLGGGNSPDSEQRLTALTRSTDGFELAEVDLEIRGEGTIMGTRQKGRSDLKLASLRRDKVLVRQAREIAFAITEEDPFLERHPDLEEEIRYLVEPDEAAFLFKS